MNFRHRNQNRYWMISFILMGISWTLSAQSSYYWIQFKDKAQSPYQITKPEQFLTPRAIERRKKQNIPIAEDDFPPNPAYIQQIQTLGFKVTRQSRWLNGIVIAADESQLNPLNNLSFIEEIRYAGRDLTQPQRDSPKKSILPLKKDQQVDDYYGYGQDQIQMLKGEFLHQQGFKGAGKLIAILDGGFKNVDLHPAFDSLRSGNQINHNYDFVELDDSSYESSTHGTSVLSVMASNLPHFMVGTAPKAHYMCLKTEDTRQEAIIEEFNWVTAIEYADSLGADIVQSSLGYTEFGDPNMDYTYNDLDGKTSYCTRACAIAAQKGMLVVISAGNEGNKTWKFIDPPADANGILSVGAVNMMGARSNFSSFGPTPDGRIKPEVSALGSATITISPFSMRIRTLNGTSVAAPIVAGLAACLWEAYPKRSSQEIIQAILKSSSQYQSPDNELGYGIPNFDVAYKLLEK